MKQNQFLLTRAIRSSHWEKLFPQNKEVRTCDCNHSKLTHFYEVFEKNRVILVKKQLRRLMSIQQDCNVQSERVVPREREPSVHLLSKTATGKLEQVHRSEAYSCLRDWRVSAIMCEQLRTPSYIT